MDNYWWEDAQPHDHVLSTVENLVDAQSYRKAEQDRAMANLYSGYVLSEPGSRPAGVRQEDHLRLNVVQSITDTLAAKISKAMPKITFLTDGGDYFMQKKAKLLEKFIMGQFYHNDVYSVARRAFTDSLVFGSGFIYVYEGDAGIEVERVPCSEILVDELEAKNGKPRQIFRVKRVNQDVLMAHFPDHKTEILNAKVEEEYHHSAHFTVMRGVEVVEAWHLPNPGQKDGRRVICIEGATLHDSAYTRAYLPFLKLDWTPRIYGYYGQGLCEQLESIQEEINSLARYTQICMELSTPKLMVERGSNISENHLTNLKWGIINYTGTPPSYVTPTPVSPQILQHLDRLYNRAYEIAGISMLSAQGRKPAGVESAVALRTISDIETERFQLVAQRYQDAFIQMARMMTDVAREMAEAGKDLESITFDDESMKKIKWSEVNLDKDSYVLKLYPTSLLPHTPAGRLQKVVELLQAQMLTKDEARKLLDYPDLKGINDLNNAAQDEIEMIIASLMDGKFISPEPYTNLTLAIKMISRAITKAKTQNVPEETLVLMRRYIEEAIAMLSAAQAPQQPAQVAPPAGSPQPDDGMARPSGTLPAQPQIEAAERMAAPMPTPQPVN